ncbi:MAG: hypothetical protein RBS24_06400 [Bacilli bacterium]|nr:hypothetical protein [Bacilli bacterium]
MHVGENMNRKGRFILPFTFFENYELSFNQKLKIFEKILILETKTNFSSLSIEYFAISELFDEIEGGIISPLYDCIITKDEIYEDISYEWKRVE